MGSLCSDPITALSYSYSRIRSVQELWLTGLTGAVFLCVSKAFDTVWVDGLLYKLTVLNFQSYLLKTIYSYFNSRTFESSFQRATTTCRRLRSGVAQDGIISPVLFSL